VRIALCLLALPLVLAACGATGEQTGGGPASTSQVPDTPSLAFDEADKTKPPPIVLESTAGRQEAVRGASCVHYTDEASGEGFGLCTDMEEPEPERLSTVRPGEEIRIVIDDAAVEGQIVVRRLGCERSVAEITLGPGPATAWQVELEAGEYELDVFVARFAAEDGRAGDLSGALGLRVDETAPLEVVPAPAAGGCDQSQSR
jgi:hypothetical protein